MGWTHASARAKGTIHGEDEPCQDAFLCEAVPQGFIACVSDGAGSADRGLAGAKLVCEHFCSTAAELLDAAPISEWTGEQIQTLLLKPRLALLKKAASSQRALTDYSSTLVGLIITSELSLAAQIGDGAVVIETEDGFSPAIWPEESEFANTTWFVNSPNAEEHFTVARLDKPILFAALFSDGLQYLVLDHKHKTAHQPFFERVRNALKREKPGEDKKASEWLQSLLESEQVTKRTDDDTSLIALRALEGK